MEDGERHKQPDAPDEDLDDVLRHGRTAVSRIGVTVDVMQMQESQERLAEPREEEPQADNHCKFEDADGEILLLGGSREVRRVGQVDELVFEDVPAEVAEVEYVGRPPDAEHDAADSHCRQYYLVHQVVNPRLGDGCLGQLATLAVELEILRQAGDGEDTCELHDPPDEHLYGQQRVARPRADDGGNEHHERDVGEEHIGAWNIMVVAPDDAPLPQGADE